MRTTLLAAAGVGVMMLLSHGFAAKAAEVKIIAAGPLTAVFKELGPQFERETGHTLATRFAATSVVKREIDAGETFDIAISITSGIDEWITEGKIVPATRAAVAYAGLGMGVRAGAPKPDIGSVEASKRALLNATSVAHGAESASAAYFKSLLERLGIAEEMKPKLKPMGPGAAYESVASGEAEIVVAVVPGIVAAPGVELVGSFPSELQTYISFAAGVSTGAKQPEVAQALIKFLTSPAAVAVTKANGMEPGTPRISPVPSCKLTTRCTGHLTAPVSGSVRRLERHAMDEHLRQEVHTALLGHADAVIRREFIGRFSSQFDALEAALLAAYARWCQLDRAFAKDHDSATVVGTTFIVVARLTMSANLLTLGQITLSGAAFRHTIEALACAFVFADPDCPHRPAAWEGKFSVNKAVSILSKQVADDPRLDRKALDVMAKVRQFYDKLSHPTVLAMGDVINLGGGGHHLGASFDEAKVPFYELELVSRVGFAQILPNAFEGIEGRMSQWPQFKNGPAALW